MLLSRNHVNNSYTIKNLTNIGLDGMNEKNNNENQIAGYQAALEQNKLYADIS